MGKSKVRTFLSDKVRSQSSKALSKISFAVKGPLPLLGTARTGQAPIVFSAFTVNSSGSPGPMPTQYSLPFIIALKERRRLAVVFTHENPRPPGQHHIGMDGQTEVFFKDFPT